MVIQCFIYGLLGKLEIYLLRTGLDKNARSSFLLSCVFRQGTVLLPREPYEPPFGYDPPAAGVFLKYIQETGLKENFWNLCFLLLNRSDLPYNPYPGFVGRLRQNGERLVLYQFSCFNLWPYCECRVNSQILKVTVLTVFKGLKYKKNIIVEHITECHVCFMHGKKKTSEQLF